ncbi:hypothetical protein ACIQTT_07880 [Microbacterium sp. NPDC090225]|uniref:arsenate reductase/protein-tyrosine-phosphatase family protein n=1 Tax=Microbacterium sp. NPDC090225 TaxID=3364207 RepID=UPI00382C6212
MTHRLIFVCEANICRSPLMELVLRAQGDAAGWQISSAGTRVGTAGNRMCVTSAEIAEAAGDAETPILAAGHRSEAIDAAELRAADLILTASRAERSAVAAAAPEARSRAFTLREAIHLGAEPVDAREFEIIAEFDADAASTTGLARYAEALHARRGFTAPPKTSRTLFGRRRNPFDIADAHHDSTREHRAMLTSTSAEVVQFLRQAAAFLDSAAGSR